MRSLITGKLASLNRSSKELHHNNIECYSQHQSNLIKMHSTCGLPCTDYLIKMLNLSPYPYLKRIIRLSSSIRALPHSCTDQTLHRATLLPKNNNMKTYLII